MEEFDCGEGKTCIPNDRVCDRINDCGDWEDEPKDKCERNECLVGNGGCDHHCFDTPGGYYCTCQEGYQLVGNTSCIG